MTDFLKQAERLQQTYQRKLPPVHLWDPPLSGDLDMRIAKSGTWYYLGGEIKRQALADLFSSILKKEGENYFLVTPVEKWKIVVENAPFIVTEFSHSSGDSVREDQFEFVTKNGEHIVAGKDHPLWMERKADQTEAQPYLLVRNDMPGLIHRNVYYQLIEIALKSEAEEKVGIWSCGEFFSLGETE